MSRVSDKTKREAMRRGWRVCKLGAVLTIPDLPTKKKRHQRVPESRLDELSKRKNILNKDGSEVVIAEQ